MKRCAAVESSSSSLATDSLDYHLPADRIATHPVDPRDSAKMLVMRRSDASGIEHRHVRDLPEYLFAGDALVFNNTAVAPARLEMRRRSGEGGRVGGLFLAEVSAHPLRWIIMLRSGGRISLGERLALLDHDGRITVLSLRIAQHAGDQWQVEVEGAPTTSEALDRVGRTPLPPYILKARHEQHETYRDQDDQRWYQTVYADAARRQSVAAPTAGLHFTPELLHAIEARGVRRIDVTLQVGPGTFKPVTAATLGQHRMHSEWFEVSAGALRSLRDIRAASGRVIAIGTTSTRTLESLPDDAMVQAESCGGVRGSTDLLIAPGHAFRHLDGLLTNFHLPRSTLLALVAAMVGLDRLLAVYREAIARGYRFYSYGDAMLILP